MSRSARHRSPARRRLLEFWWDIQKRRRYARSKRVIKGPGVYFEGLESRVLLSGGAEGVLAGTDMLAHLARQDFSQASVAAEIMFLGEARETALLNLSGLARPGPEMEPDPMIDGTGTRELVFVDETLTDYEQLIADLEQAKNNRTVEVAVLKSDWNGIEQVSQVLWERSNLTALHFITHGADGKIALGNTWLNSTTLQQNTDAISSWGKALIETGDILFYGCNVAAGSAGQSLLNTISDLTGADVAASDDLTGNAQLGGDWNLEYRVGDVETTFAAPGHSWEGLLANFTVNITTDTVDANPGDGLAQDASGNTSLRAAIMEANALTGADSITLPAGNYDLTLMGSGENAAATGDLDITGQLTINGAGAKTTVIDAATINDRVFDLPTAATNVTISGVTIQNGYSNSGGAINVEWGSSQLILQDASLSSNESTTNGGAILTCGNLTLERVTIEGNIGVIGGGIWGGNGTVITLTNVTLSGNSASKNAGALFTQGDAYLTNVTVANNSSNQAGGAGGIDVGGSDKIYLRNSILWNNTNAIDGLVNAGNALDSQDYNIDSDGTAGLSGSNDQSGTILSPLDPLIGPLQDNGGQTRTHALLTGSPAIDPAGLSGAPPLDQRGYTRDATPDIGAYEFNAGSSNQAPTLTSFAGPLDTTAEDTEVEITLAELKAQGDESDVDGTVDAFAVKAISTGTLKIGATAGTATAWAAGTNDTINATNNAYWTPANNANGTLNAFTVVAKDNDGAESAAPVQAQITVTAVNDAPVITSASLTVSEGQTVTLSGANFGITDPDDSSFTYTVSGIAGGYFQLSSSPGTPITNFTSANLSGSLVQFVDDGNEVAPAFSVTVNDGDVDSNTLAATITYTPVNDAPLITSASLTVSEGQTVTLAPANFGITDPDDGSFTYNLSGISGGYFQLSNSSGTPITNFTSADLAGGLVQFVDDGNEVAPTFSVTVNDGDVDSNTLAATVTYTPVNDAPLITSASLTVSEGQTVTLSGANFSITDPDDVSFTYTVSAISGGYFQLSNSSGTPITNFTSADLAGGLVQFVDDGNEVAPTFSVTVNDGDVDSNTLPATVTYTPVNDVPVITSASMTVNEGQTVTLAPANFGITDPDDGSFTYNLSGISGGYFQLSTSPGTPITTFTSANLSGSLVQFVDDGNEVAPAFSVTVNDGDADSNTLPATVTYTPVNDVPVITSASMTVNEGQTVTLAPANFGITDPDDVSFTYTVSGIAGGYFQLSTSPGTPITTFTSANLAGGLVQFVDDGNEVAPTFSVTVNDGDVDSNTLAATVTYTPVNDAPLITSASLTVSEGQTVTLSGANFGITDPDDGSFTYNLSGISGGYFQLSTSPGTPITTFTSANLVGSLVQFVDDGNEVAPAFGVTVNDGDADSNTLAATISYTPVNDAPVITSASLTVNEGQTLTLSGANFGITDPDDGSFTYTVSGISGGYFQLSTSPGTPITTFTSADLAGGLVQFVDDGNEVAPAFGVTVNDGDVDSNTLAATVTYTPVNDAPLITSASLTVSEGQTVTLSGANFSITDPDDVSFTYTVSAISGGYFQLSSSPGTPITNFTSANLSGSLVQFVDDGNEVAPAFSVTVNDGDADSNTLPATVTYTPVNDAPVITSASMTVNEGQTVTLAPANFGITDPDDVSFTYTVSGIAGGYFQLSSAPGTPITNFTSANLAGSLVQFVDDGNEVAPAFGVTVNDGDADSNTLAATITYTPVNDAPTNSVPGVEGTAEDTPLVFSNGNGNLISISDPDAGANPVQVTLTGSNGTVSLAGIGGLAFTVGDGTDDAGMTFTGTMANINAALDGLTFTPSTGFSGGAAVQISTNDQGNSGSGVPLTDTDTVNINVSNVNTPPSATNLSAPESYTEDTPLNLTDIVVTDADSPNVTVILTLSDPTAGSLSTGTSGAVTSTYNAGTGVWTASGSIADVNTLLTGVTFTPALNYNSNFTIATSVSDGVAAPITGVKNMTSIPVNDGPTGSVTISGTPTEDQILTASNTLADADGMGAVSYQWQRDGLDIVGGMGSTYTLGDVDAGTTITVVAEYTDSEGTNESVSSAGMGPVANVNDAPVGVPAISGTVTEDEVLTADTAAISDADGLGAFSYQWLRNGVAIDGATASTYTLGDTDVNAQISVTVSYIDGHGTAETLTSAQTEAVAEIAEISDAPVAIPPITTTPPEPQAPAVDPSAGIGSADVPGTSGFPQWPGNDATLGNGSGSPNSQGNNTVDTDNSKASEQEEIPNEEVQKEAVPKESKPTLTRPSEKRSAMSNPPGRTDLRPILLRKEGLPNTEMAQDEQSTAVQENVMRAREYDYLRDSLDALKKEMTAEIKLNKMYLGSAIVSSIGLSVGYVVWLLRGGMLLASLLSSIPAWQFLDPLPILARKKDDDHSDDNESLESIVAKNPRQINLMKKTADPSSDAEVKGQ